MAGGRQREFDKQEVLDRAMRIFWQKGFSGASLADLTRSMEINKPSLYATFGNKEQLFIEATEHYIDNYAKQHFVHLSEEKVPLKKRLKNYLMSIVSTQCDSSNPKGCYISLCVSESASDSIPINALESIEKARDFAENYLSDFFAAEVTKENLALPVNPANLALYFVCVLHGTAALARGGKTCSDLASIIDNALLLPCLN